MGTDNPKVSAYVPQLIKDRVTQFRQEQGISESQAVTIILAEYFGLNQLLVRSPGESAVGGVTLARMEALEEKFASLTTLPSSIPSELLEKIDQLSLSVSSLGNRLEAIEQSSILSGLKGGLKEPDLLVAPQEVEEATGQPGLDLEDGQSIEDSGNGQLELIEPAVFNPLSEPLEEISPIPGIKLSKSRFGLSEAMIAGTRRKKSFEDFIKWTKEKDPDHIAWKYVEAPSKGYVPAEELSSELKINLLKWIKENL